MDSNLFFADRTEDMIRANEKLKEFSDTLDKCKDDICVEINDKTFAVITFDECEPNDKFVFEHSGKDLTKENVHFVSNSNYKGLSFWAVEMFDVWYMVVTEEILSPTDNISNLIEQSADESVWDSFHIDNDEYDIAGVLLTADLMCQLVRNEFN